ncbi:MAG: hypothetical protein VXB01_12815, partial [Opitutae bacterium]
HFAANIPSGDLRGCCSQDFFADPYEIRVGVRFVDSRVTLATQNLDSSLLTLLEKLHLSRLI